MKVLMFGMSNQKGGLEAVIHPMIPLLRESGIKVDFANAFPGPLDKENWLIEQGSQIIPINLKRRGRLLKYVRSMHVFFKQASRNYDAMWLNINEPDCGDLLKLAARFGIRKRIVVSHMSRVPRSVSKLRNLSVWWSRHLIAKYATHRIAISAPSGQFAYQKAHFSIIHSGIDIERFRFSPSRREKMRKRFSFSDEIRVLACTCRLIESKNLFFLIDIVGTLLKTSKDYRLIILGNGPLREQLLHYIKSKSLDRCAYLIHDADDIVPYLDCADYFVFPSKHEGLSMSLLEAQCSGLPCFADVNGIPREVALDERSFHWLDLTNGPEAWAQSIHRTPMVTQCERNNGYEKIASSDYSLTCSAQKYIAILSDEPNQ